MAYLYTTLPVLYKDKIKVLDKKLFASPYKGISSLFLAQSISGRIHSKVKSKSFKITYKEWSDNTACQDIALSKIHMYLHGVKDFEPFTLKSTGYIYKIDYNKYKNNIKNLKWMDPSKECIIAGLDTIEFESVEKITAEIEISPEDFVKEATYKEAEDMIIKNEILEFERRYKKPIPPKLVEPLKKDVKEYFAKIKNVRHFLIKHKGVVVIGYRPEFKCYEISEAYVEDKYRGQGIGSKIMEHVFKKFGKNLFIVEANASNKLGLALYHKFGFKLLTTIKHKENFVTVLLQRPGD